jgi:hypothetical protein
MEEEFGFLVNKLMKVALEILFRAEISLHVILCSLAGTLPV